MKPDHIQPNKGQWNFSDADTMVDFCIDNDIKIIGHTLVWHSQSPAWMAQSNAEENMRTYIRTVMNRYSGKIYAWDVVNEAFRDGVSPEEASQGWRNCLRTDSMWYQAMGEEYLYKAFKYAKEYSNGAKLIYNDFNLDMPGKRDAAAQMVQEFNEQYKKETNSNALLIDVIGMQSHNNVFTSTANVEASIKKFASIGVKVHITELDLCVYESSGKISSADEQRQADLYRALFNVYTKYSDVIERVTFWGYEDGSSWRGANFPCLFNSDLSPKKAFDAVMSVGTNN